MRGRDEVDDKREERGFNGEGSVEGFVKRTERAAVAEERKGAKSERKRSRQGREREREEDREEILEKHPRLPESRPAISKICDPQFDCRKTLNSRACFAPIFAIRKTKFAARKCFFFTILI
jgi:hypothetical protein